MQMPAGASQLMTQKNGSHGGPWRLGEHTGPVKGVDATWLQPAVAMWNASPASLGLLASQENPQIQVIYET